MSAKWDIAYGVVAYIAAVYFLAIDEHWTVSMIGFGYLVCGTLFIRRAYRLNRKPSEESL